MCANNIGRLVETMLLVFMVIYQEHINSFNSSYHHLSIYHGSKQFTVSI